MRKLLFLPIFCSFIVLNTWGQKQPVMVEKTESGSSSFILFPDPQNYSKFDVNQPLFELMTAWCANNVEKLNIQAVLCTGDLVEQNDRPVADGINGNQSSTKQWQSVSKAFERLDHVVPYVLCTGNHDYGHVSAENRMSRFSEYFQPERNNKWNKSLVSVEKNWEGKHTLENAAYEFKLDHWGDMLVISLEFAPRDEVLDWAKKLADSDKYKNHRIIILTHSYLTIGAKHIEKEGYKVTPANYGKTIWERLVYPTPNICMVLCGHSCRVGTIEETVSFRTDKNEAGKDIPQMMFNAQTADGSWNGNGGDGWLRILEFLPDGKTVQVRTFSPLFAISPTTAQYAWRTESYDEFRFEIK